MQFLYILYETMKFHLKIGAIRLVLCCSILLYWRLDTILSLNICHTEHFYHVVIVFNTEKDHPKYNVAMTQSYDYVH